MADFPETLDPNPKGAITFYGKGDSLIEGGWPRSGGNICYRVQESEQIFCNGGLNFFVGAREGQFTIFISLPTCL